MWETDFTGYTQALCLDDREAALLSGWVRTNFWARPEAADVLDRMRAQGIRPDVITYVCLATPYGRRGDVEKVEDLLERQYVLSIFSCIQNDLKSI